MIKNNGMDLARLRPIINNRHNQVILLMFMVVIVVNLVLLKPIKYENKTIKGQIDQVQGGQVASDTYGDSKRKADKNIYDDIEFYRTISRDRSISEMELSEFEGRVLYKIKFNQDKIGFDKFVDNLQAYKKKVYIKDLSYIDGRYEISLYKK